MDKTMKWLSTGAFTVLLIGGLNYLLMGLFKFNLFGAMSGGEGLVGRIFYSLFGVSALLLLLTVIARAVTGNKKNA